MNEKVEIEFLGQTFNAIIDDNLPKNHALIVGDKDIALINTEDGTATIFPKEEYLWS